VLPVRKIGLLLASMALAVLLLTDTIGNPTTVAQPSPERPNFVFIIADDMRADDLRYMPKTRSLLGRRQGMRFDSAYVSYGLCCPSRATIMRGQYAHNHGVWSNLNGPNGGWQGYKNHGNEKDNLATRLHSSGYRTGLLGKYLNGYSGTTVPPGWDDWFATSSFAYFDYDVNDNGHLRHFGTGKNDYLTDVLSDETQEFIDASVVADKPFFAYVAPLTPHGPVDPAPRHLRAYDGERARRPPSFNEKTVNDKPPRIQSLRRLSTNRITGTDTRHEKRAETLQALDDLVEAVVRKLRTAGVLHNTYIVFTSDNGFQEGEHRVSEGKARPYEESIHVPLLVRGPRVKAGSTTDELTLNTDFLPTFTDLAGIATPAYVDGRSLRPLLEGRATTPWRTAILLERRVLEESNSSFYGIRTSNGRKYITYRGGFRELYNLNTDPYELVNSYDEVELPSALAARLKALKGCAGATCRAVEDGNGDDGRSAGNGQGN
jgi:N-acetylglucosamine-6-sulfatase